MKLIRKLALAAALLAVFAATTAQLVIDDGNDNNQNSGGTSGGASATYVAGSDTIRTGAVMSLGAASIIYSISATTGMDSVFVPLVSQDDSHYFTAAQDGATSSVLKVGYGGLDSLRNGPHTFSLSYTDGKTTIPFPYRYTKLKLYGKVGGTITGLRVVGTAVYDRNNATAYQHLYNDSW